jgi:hypothetical protein
VSFTPIRVTGSYKVPTGAGAVGTIHFALPVALVQPGTVVPAGSVDVAPDATGAFSIILLANDDPSTVPAGTAYLVTESLGPVPRTYSIVVPRASASGTVDISTLH